MGRILLWCSTAVVLLCLGVVLFASVGSLLSSPPARGEPASGLEAPFPLRDHLLLHGMEETGAINLVSAIYLGYRAFDTLGETIVLVLSVAAVVLITGAK